MSVRSSLLMALRPSVFHLHVQSVTQKGVLKFSAVMVDLSFSFHFLQFLYYVF